MPADLAMDPQTARRIAWALGLSVAVHAALVVLIQAQPGGAPTLAGSWTVNARIEHQAPAPSDSVPAPVELPEPAKAEQNRTTTAAEPAPDAKLARERAGADAKVATGGAVKSAAQPPGIEMPFVRDPNYYAVAALDSPPRLLGAADGCYPQGAVGEVAYVLMINEQGTVDQVTVTSVNPQGLFIGAAVDLCSRLKFTPGVKDGRAVRSRVRFVVGSNPS